MERKFKPAGWHQSVISRGAEQVAPAVRFALGTSLARGLQTFSLRGHAKLWFPGICVYAPKSYEDLQGASNHEKLLALMFALALCVSIGVVRFRPGRWRQANGQAGREEG